MIKPYLLVPIAIGMPLLWSRRAHYTRQGLVVRVLAFLVALALAQVVLSGSARANVPVVSGVSPAQGSVAGGEQVTISGSGFAAGAGGSCAGTQVVWFGTDVQHGYAIASPHFQVVSDTQLRATVPASFGGVVDVRVHTGCGTSTAGSADQFTYDYPTSQCLTGSCSVTVSDSAVGVIGHVADGVLDGLNTDAGVTISASVRRLIDALHPRGWRLGQAGLTEPGGGVFGLARGAGAQVTLDLTSDWQDWAYTHDRPYFQAPYDDLSTYSTFIADDVRQRIVAGQVPDYFDVWNEPSTTGTVNQWLSVYGAAYHAIKSVEPSAAVEGPSIPAFLVASSGHLDTPGYQLSLTDFLNWEMSSGVRMAALSWHEDGTTVQSDPGAVGLPLPGGYRDYWSPSALSLHVAAARALLARYPALSGTQLFVNEYGPTYAVNIPGWMVGDFSALEASGASQGMITCATNSACNNLLDGLIGTDGAPQMPYWVVRAYAQMSGVRVGTLTSGSNVYALAGRNDANHTLTLLVGRADDCFGGQQCPQFQAAGAGRVALNVSVALPWATSVVNVSVQPLRDSATNPIGSNDVATAPPASVSRLAVRCGSVGVPIPGVGDGDAVAVTITTPSAAAPTRTAYRGTRAPAVMAPPVANCVASGRLAASRTANAPLRRRTHTPRSRRRVPTRR